MKLFSNGSRAMQTLRKLPTIAPKTNTKRRHMTCGK
jgi:hypothetical protein